MINDLLSTIAVPEVKSGIKKGDPFILLDQGLILFCHIFLQEHLGSDRLVALHLQLVVGPLQDLEVILMSGYLLLNLLSNCHGSTDINDEQNTIKGEILSTHILLRGQGPSADENFLSLMKMGGNHNPSSRNLNHR